MKQNRVSIPNTLPRFPAHSPSKPGTFKPANVKYKGHLTAKQGKIPADVYAYTIARRQAKARGFK